jgi:hypothetical protein
MAIQLDDTTRNDMMDAVLANIDAGVSPGYIEIRSGTRPANVNTAATGTVLATLTLTDPAGTVTGDTLTFDADPDISAVAAATGTASWARVYDSAANARVDGDVGTTGTDFIITSTSITSGQTVTLTAGTLQLAA